MSLLDLVNLIQDTDGAEPLWGPSKDTPDKFKDIPYAPYSKSDKIGRVVDWNSDASAANESRPGGGRRPGRYGREARDVYGSAAAGTFAYFHEEDESSFLLVDGNRNAAKRGGASGTTNLGRGRGRTRGTPALGGRGLQRGTFGRGGGRGRGRGGRFGWKDYENKTSRESSVVVGHDWQMLEEIEFSRLTKLRLEVDTQEPEELSSYGFLYEYDRTYDKVNTKTERPLQPTERIRYNPSTSDDPIIQSLASKDRGQIFVTDSILALIMCCTRTVYPWDLVLTREGDKLFIDKRDGGALDFWSVNENAGEPPIESTDKDGINTPSALSLEATYLNQLFAWQVVKEDHRISLENPNPFYSDDEPAPPASCGYRYRRFDLSITENEDVGLVVRTEVDSVLKGGDGDDTYVTIRALNEFDPRAPGSGGAPDWRSKLDSQRGAVVATEMKNNSSKLARWAVQSILAGAEQMKIGYVSRVNFRDASRHTILGTQWYKARDFASQMNVNLANGWGIIRTIADICLKQPEGKYVLLKDPNKTIIRIYRVPFDAFDAEEDQLSEAEQSVDEFGG